MKRPALVLALGTSFFCAAPAFADATVEPPAPVIPSVVFGPRASVAAGNGGFISTEVGGFLQVWNRGHPALGVDVGTTTSYSFGPSGCEGARPCPQNKTRFELTLEHHFSPTEVTHGWIGIGLGLDRYTGTRQVQPAGTDYTQWYDETEARYGGAIVPKVGVDFSARLNPMVMGFGLYAGVPITSWAHGIGAGLILGIRAPLGF
jgi:hypothetical protein